MTGGHDDPGGHDDWAGTMTPGLSVRGLGKRYGRATAVEDLSFAVPAGQVTGFLGPNGAGKTTTLRMLLGLARPDAGQALLDGQRYQQLRQPRRVVGAVLETSSFHPGRRAGEHLRIIAEAAGIPAGRVEVVLAQVGL